MPREYLAHVDVVRLFFATERPKVWDMGALFSIRVEFCISRHARGGFDVDNLLKTVLDAGNDLLWNDDRQVVEAHIRKHHRVPDDAVGTTLQVGPVG